MGDNTLPAMIGFLSGAALVLLLIILIVNLDDRTSTQTAQMSSYNVVRDDQGRIQSVETLSGLPLEGTQTQQRARTQHEEPPQSDAIHRLRN